MNFKKYLKTKNKYLKAPAWLEIGCPRQPTGVCGVLSLTGQAAVEYFVIFSIITLLTILSFSSFDDQVSNSTGNFSKEAIKRILQ